MYEKDKEGVLACASMYEEYESFCTNQHIKPSAPPVFGKYIYQVNPFRFFSLFSSLSHLVENKSSQIPTNNKHSTSQQYDTTLRTKRNSPHAQIEVYPGLNMKCVRERKGKNIYGIVLISLQV